MFWCMVYFILFYFIYQGATCSNGCYRIHLKIGKILIFWWNIGWKNQANPHILVKYRLKRKKYRKFGKIWQNIKKYRLMIYLFKFCIRIHRYWIYQGYFDEISRCFKPYSKIWLQKSTLKSYLQVSISTNALKSCLNTKIVSSQRNLNKK